MSSNKRVIVGMSGGVDSSVAALLLLKQGFQVEGLFMKNWEEDDTDSYCSATEDLKDATSVCQSLGIPLHTANFAAEYWDDVFEHFLKEYKAGRTPNPDILCNREIKFKAFLNYAMELGADFIATGHYAMNNTFKKNIENYRDNKSSHGINEDIEVPYFLYKGRDNNKDQSYFLYTLSQEVLSKTLFPIGHLEKTMVRKIADEAGFQNSRKKDSTGICFIGERKFKNFLSQYLKPMPGNIETPEGKHLGKHDGLMYYTIGQRQGIGIGGLKDEENAPWYVVDKDTERNVLIVAQGEHPLLYKQQLVAKDCHWVQGIPPALDKNTFKENTLEQKMIEHNILEQNCYSAPIFAKIRYRQSEQSCKISFMENDPSSCTVTFESPQRAVTPGQSIVFSQNEFCLGGGTIQ